jgi:hypothetical protein
MDNQVGILDVLDSVLNTNRIFYQSVRVLNGNINVSLFPYLCDDSSSIEPFAVNEFKKNDITWISPSLNQVHQLKNLESNKTSCITIQCYLYDNDDKIHYDYFDYLDDKNAKNQYEPDSDMDFLEFKKTIKDEWLAFTKV